MSTIRALFLVLVATLAAQAEESLPDGLVLWLRADQGVTTDEQGIVQQWSDSSGNGWTGNALAISGPGIQVDSTAINGQPALTFAGDAMVIPGVLAQLNGGGGELIRVQRRLRERTGGHQFAIPNSSPEYASDGYITSSFGRGSAGTSLHGRSALGWLIEDHGIETAPDYWGRRIHTNSVNGGYVNAFLEGNYWSNVPESAILGYSIYERSETSDDGNVYDGITGPSHNMWESYYDETGSLRNNDEPWTWYDDQGFYHYQNDAFRSNEFFDGQVAEVLLFNRQLLQEERQSVLAYLNAKYAILAPPQIVVQPVSQSVGLGKWVSLQVKAGPEPLDFQWFRNGKPIPNAVEPTLWVGTWNSQDTSDSYSVTVSNPLGEVQSDSALITISTDVGLLEVGVPWTGSIPENSNRKLFRVEIPVDGTYTFRLDGAWIPESSYTLLYGWAEVRKSDGNVLSYLDWQQGYYFGMDNNVYGELYSKDVFLRQGSYYFPVENGYGTVPDTFSCLVVPTTSAPKIVYQPASAQVQAGQSATFQVWADRPAAYQWFRNGVEIGGENNQTLLVANVGPSNAGANYQVQVSNAAGSVWSQAATLTISGIEVVNLGVPWTGAFAPWEGKKILSFDIPVAGFYTVRIDGDWTLDSNYTLHDVSTINCFGQNGDLIGAVNMSYGNFYGYLVSGDFQFEAGHYFVEINALYEGEEEQTFACTVAETVIPRLLTQPISQQCSLGDTVYLDVRVDRPATYQWLRNGVEMEGETSWLLRVTSWDPADSSATYQVQVTNAAGSVLSEMATINVRQFESLFVGTPWTGACAAGEFAKTFRVEIPDDGIYSVRVDGAWTPQSLFTLPNAYVTLHQTDGHYLTNIYSDYGYYFGTNGSVSGQLQKADIHLTAGTYWLRVIDNYRSAALPTFSCSVTRTVVPRILAQPESIRVGLGGWVTFAVGVDGPATFQWLRNGQPIAYATSRTFQVQNWNPADDGTKYQVRITNAAGSVLSQEAMLLLDPASPLAIGEIQPQNLTTGVTRQVFTVEIPQAAPYRVTAQGSGVSNTSWTLPYLSCYVYDLTGKNLISMSNYGYYGYYYGWGSPLQQAVTLEAGTYIVVISSSYSGTYGLGVSSLSPPTISTSPVSMTVKPGASQSFSVVAGGVGLRYQWYRDGVAIAGATGSTHTPEVPINSPGNTLFYTVTVTNDAGQVTSSPVTLTIPPPIDLSIDTEVGDSLNSTDPTDVLRLKVSSATSLALVTEDMDSRPALTAYNLTMTVYDEQGVQLSSTGVIETASSLGNPMAYSRRFAPGTYFIKLSVNSYYWYYGWRYGTYTVAARTLAVPTLVTDPVDQEVRVAQSASFEVTTQGYGLSYQWLVNGVTQPGETARTYSRYVLSNADDGLQVSVRVSNLVGSVTSRAATLRVATRLPQVITGFTALSAATVGDAPQSISGVTGGGSGNSVYFTSSDNSVAYVSGLNIYPYGAGTVTITAIQDGNGQYLPAPPVSQTFVVSPRTQTITFAQPADFVLGTPPFLLLATSSADLPVEFRIHTGPAEIINRQLAVQAAGTIEIEAFQPGTTNVLPATPVQRTITVRSQVPIITALSASHDAEEGVSIPLEVTIGNPYRATYQWLRDTVPLAGGTASRLTAFGPAVGTAADYQVQVTNSAGTTTSAIIRLTGIIRPPSITGQPAPVTVPAGGTTTVTVTAEGTPPLAYQWFRDDLPIPGATQVNYTTEPLSFDDNQATLRCRVSNRGGEALSRAVTLTVQAPPSITRQPQGMSVELGTPITFSVVAVGTPTLTYQWLRDGVLLSGATSATLVRSQAIIGDDGAQYSVRVSNSFGQVTSESAQLHVTVSPPEIITAPVATEIPLGGVGNLTVTARSGLPVTFQWQRESIDLPGATGQILSIPGDVPGQALYAVRVTNAQGSVTSSSVLVRVAYVPVTIAVAPLGHDVAVGQGASFQVTAQGSAPLTYQWLRDGQPVPGAVAERFEISSATQADAGARIQVVITNPAGSVTTNAVTLQVHRPPTIRVQPVGQTVYEASSATFRIIVDSTAPLTYRWYRDDVLLTRGAGATLTTDPTIATDDGRTFRVEADSLAGTVVSASVRLSVLARRPQVISGFDSLPLATVGQQYTALAGVYGGASGNQVTFTSNDSTVVAIYSDGTLLPLLAGTVIITAHQAGSVEYAPAPPITQELTVTKAKQTIAFEPLWPQSLGNVPVELTAKATSRLPVSYSVLSGPGALVGSKVAIQGVGTIVVAADQAGNLGYLPAERVTHDLIVTAEPPRILRQSQAVQTAAGQPVTLQVELANPVGAMIRWLRDEVIIADAQALSLTVNAPSHGQTVRYRAIISNAVGETATDSMPVTGIATPPVVTQPPTGQAMYLGQQASFTVMATGTPPLSYEWQRNGSAIPGANTDAFLLPTVTAADDGAVFQVVVRNAAGQATSTPAVLRIYRPPTITVPPRDLTIDAGRSATWTVTADTGGFPSVSYTWYRDGRPVTKASGTTYTLPSVGPADDQARISVEVDNPLGRTLSATSVLTVVITPPVFTVDPRSQILNQSGAEIIFSAEVASALPVTYQWQRAGVPIPGATGSTYRFAPTQADLGVTYTVRGTNDQGSTTSGNATISRPARPVITGQPMALTVQEGQAAAFHVTAQSFAPDRVLAYRWFRNDEVLPWAGGANVTLPTVSLADDGAKFQVEVADGDVVRVSQIAVLTVRPVPPPAPLRAPRLGRTSVPMDLHPSVGDVVTLWVEASGDDLTYQWFRNDQPLPGPQESTLSLVSIDQADYGAQFHVVVTNPVGQETSPTWTLSNTPRVSVVDGLRPQYTPGEQPRLSVTYTGAPDVHLEWLLGDTPIPGTAGPVLVLAPLTKADQGLPLRVRVTNPFGEHVASLGTIQINDQAPQIKRHPIDAQIGDDRAARFYVEADSLSAATVQWFHDGQAIAGGTDWTLRVPITTAAMAEGRYHAEVTNRFGTTASTPARIITPPPMVILQQPVPMKAFVGGKVTFTVEVQGGSRPLKYQWFRDGVIATMVPVHDPLQVIDVVQPSHHGSRWHVKITDAAGQQLESVAVPLTVADESPTIITPPVDQSATLGQGVVFRVVARGTEPLLYQWYRDGEPIPNTNSDLLALSVTSLVQDHGRHYHVVVSNGRGQVASDPVLLSVSHLPAIPLTEGSHTIGEVRGNSLVLRPLAVVSNGDTNGIFYTWESISSPQPLVLPSSYQASSQVSLTQLAAGDYRLRCRAMYAPGAISGNVPYLNLASADQEVRFRVSADMTWIKSPHRSAFAPGVLDIPLEALAGFSGKEDPAMVYRWLVVSGPGSANITENDHPGARKTRLLVDKPGVYLVRCVADWRGRTLTATCRVDTEASSPSKDDTPADETDVGAALNLLAGRTLLLLPEAFDSARWETEAAYRTAYLRAVEPGRVWLAAPTTGDAPRLAAVSSLWQRVAAGTEVTLQVATPEGAPVSWAALHGGIFSATAQNAITVAAGADGATVVFRVPNAPGRCSVQVASPLCSGRLVFNIVVQ